MVAPVARDARVPLLALAADFGDPVQALVGLLLAFAGLGLTHLTGTPIWDGIASLAIGGLLIGVAIFTFVAVH